MKFEAINACLFMHCWFLLRWQVANMVFCVCVRFFQRQRNNVLLRGIVQLVTKWITIVIVVHCFFHTLSTLKTRPLNRMGKHKVIREIIVQSFDIDYLSVLSVLSKHSEAYWVREGRMTSTKPQEEVALRIVIYFPASWQQSIKVYCLYFTFTAPLHAFTVS